MTSERLERTRYLTLVARLLLNARGSLVRGELADAEGNTLVRFVGQDGLLNAVRTYLAGFEEEASREQSAPEDPPSAGSA